MKIPAFVLRKLYVKGSLRAIPGGVRFTLKNSLATASLIGLKSLQVDGLDVPAERVQLSLDGQGMDLGHVTSEKPFVFPRNADADIEVSGVQHGTKVKVRMDATSAEFGDLLIEFEDELAG